MLDLPEQNAETYLGDGCYVSFDGYHVRLRAPRESGDHFVWLEPEVYRALLAWISSHPRLSRHMNGVSR